MLRRIKSVALLTLLTLVGLAACSSPPQGSLFIDKPTVNAVQSSNATLIIHGGLRPSVYENSTRTVIESTSAFNISRVRQNQCLQSLADSLSYCDTSFCRLDYGCEVDGSAVECPGKPVDCQLNGSPEWSRFSVSDEFYNYGLYTDDSVIMIHRHEREDTVQDLMNVVWYGLGGMFIIFGNLPVIAWLVGVIGFFWLLYRQFENYL